MIVRIDAQISPYLAPWLSSQFDVEAKPVRELGLREAKDRDIFLAAREAEAVVLTKDRDFVLLLEQLGPPPQVLWLTVGNTSNAYLKEILSKSFPAAHKSCSAAASHWSRSRRPAARYRSAHRKRWSWVVNHGRQ